jgi:MEMO1 family protein
MRKVFLILRCLVINELKNDPEFRWEETTKAIEEKEHSLEMHLPYIRKMFGSNFKLVPMMVGGTSPEQEKAYGKCLAKYFDRKDSIFVISSDFCHWGTK